MDLSNFGFFWQQLLDNPLLMLAVVMTMGVILVNGWTDAPNAIATCVVTRCISPRLAILMAAVCNFLGVLIMSMLNATVAETITKMVDFGDNTQEAIIALSAALFAIVIWATAAWIFGIPTSESHALIAGLTGSAIAMHGGLGGVNGAEWVKVIYGMVISVFLGFGLGWGVCRVVTMIFRNVERRLTEKFFRGAQIFGAAFMAFMHSAQDGQKFMGVILMAVMLANGQTGGAAVAMPVWLMLLCSIVMGIGTSIGGNKIIKSVGMDMVKLEKYQGFSADIAAAISLLLSSVFGIPVSTTHAKTTSIMGVGAVRRISAINFGVVKEMAMTWILTFPGCGLIGFIMTKIFIAIF
ncbi:MAG: inorganic phosphate transporter [Oscillospiraceae bacterium]|nr:inorganic phosphate transporter [Oscillospiraceae bacterium]